MRVLIIIRSPNCILFKKKAKGHTEHADKRQIHVKFGDHLEDHA